MEMTKNKNRIKSISNNDDYRKELDRIQTKSWLKETERNHNTESYNLP